MKRAFLLRVAGVVAAALLTAGTVTMSTSTAAAASTTARTSATTAASAKTASAASAAIPAGHPAEGACDELQFIAGYLLIVGQNVYRCEFYPGVGYLWTWIGYLASCNVTRAGPAGREVSQGSCD
jgi:hypothetical protein